MLKKLGLTKSSENPPKVMTELGAAMSLGLPFVMMFMGPFLGLVFIAEVISAENAPNHALWERIAVAFMWIYILAACVIGAVGVYRSLKKKGYWEAVRQHSIKLRQEWEAENNGQV